MSTLLIAPAALFGTGILLALIAFMIYQRRRDLLTNGMRTAGMVVAYKEDSDGLYAPVFQFMTMIGEPVQFASSTYSSMRPFAVGQMVPLAYDPTNPRRVAILHSSGMLVVYFLAGMGLVMIASGVLVLLVMR